MGLKLFSDSPSSTPQPPNPNPKNFKIMAGSVFENKRTIIMLEVFYPGCTTLDGIKILVYECDFEKFLPFLSKKDLDPHFLDPHDSRLSPIARFPATEEGIEDALRFSDWKSRQ